MDRKWWKDAVVYQIFPSSFCDSDGDGIGDLNGIISKLDYIKDIGFNVIWLCPIYKSPNDDSGYDISDYCDIMNEFGSMEDFNRLLEGVHVRNMKLIMDMVVNHTSDVHPWFVESRSSKNNPKRDYYIWREGKKGREPNNWSSYFSPSVWEYDKNTGEYYFHLFSRKQPDLNWNNCKVREEIYNIMRFWLDKGIDGFRMDAVNLILKAAGFPDSEKAHTTADGYVFDEDLYSNQPGIHEILREMNGKVLSKYDIMTVGETLNVTPEIAAQYVNEDRNELNMVCQFELMMLDAGPRWKWDVIPWKLTDFKKIVTHWQIGVHEKGWTSFYLSNHDQPRMVSRFGNDKKYRKESAKMLATLLLTLQGTPFIYQGEEIGMINVRFSSIEDYRDLEIFNYYNEAVNKYGLEAKKAMESIYKKGRDNQRTPMQWNSKKNAGFTGGKPWIKVNPNYKKINVRQSVKDPNSILNYYNILISLRKEYPVFVYGDYNLLLKEDEQIYAYTRTLCDEKLLVILNFSCEYGWFSLPCDIEPGPKKLLISNYEVEKDKELNNTRLRPYEARVYKWN